MTGSRPPRTLALATTLLVALLQAACTGGQPTQSRDAAPSPARTSTAAAGQTVTPTPTCADWGHWAFFESASLDDVRECLEAGADPNDMEWGPPLHMAARSTPDPAIIALLLSSGADANARDWDGRTPLHAAAESNALAEVAATLLDAGADPGAPDREGVTPLHLAAHQNENPEIVTILVQAGADPNSRGPDGLTPLHMTWQTTSAFAPRVVRELLRLGADGLARDDLGRAADPTRCGYWNTAAFARIAVRADFARCLEQGADLFDRDDSPLNPRDGGYTVLHHATANEDPSVIPFLVEAGADLEARNDRGLMPLHVAVSNRNLAAVTALLEAGADLSADAGGSYGTPLDQVTLWISRSPSDRNAVTIAIVDALVAAGSDVNAVDQSGNPPLLRVLRKGGSLSATTDLEPDSAASAHAGAIVGLALRLLEAGADPAAQGARGETPLHAAARYRTPAPARALLDAGADPDARTEMGDSPLHRAARSGIPEVIALLVAAGAEINGQNEQGLSPLHSAVLGGVPFRLPMVSPRVSTDPVRIRAAALLEAGADPNLQSAEGDTPLHLAAQVFDTALVSLLVGAGADVNARNNAGETPSQAARNHANGPVARKLLDLGADPGVLAGTGATDGPLCDLGVFLFVDLAPVETLRECLEAGISVSTPDELGRTPLVQLMGSSASSPDDTHKVELLLAAGADANARMNAERTPLHLVAEGTTDGDRYRSWLGPAGRTAAAALLEAGAEVDARDSQGETPLHKALRQDGDSAVLMVELLLEARADVNARAGDGRSPLHLAASLGRTAAIPVLIEAGAEVDARADDGHTPLHLALLGGRPVIAASLQAAGADPAAPDGNGRIVDPTSCEHWGTRAFFVFATADVVAGCVDGGADLHSGIPREGPSIPTPLHVAAVHSRDPAAITTLVQAGADVGARDNYGNSPLHEAAEHGTAGVVRALLAAGAEVDAKLGRSGFDLWFRGGDTPLHLAATNQDPAVAAALLEAGADVNGWGRGGMSPLHRAASNRNPEVAELLLEAGAEVNARTSGGITPLHDAAEARGTPEVLAVLLEAGADVHALGSYNWSHAPAGRLTPLHSAAYYSRNPEIVTMLVAAGADPDGGMGNTSPAFGPGAASLRPPIHLAMSNRNPAVIEALLRAGADLDATDSEGHTILHRAALYTPFAFPRLLRLGADPEVRDAEGKTPMDYARENPALQPWERVRMSTTLGNR
ncbi:MAG: ankyrin repeat domain-containing protein [Gemmatimonadota bacterium]|nr:ankyrin repeat domain-containing protein [Gemmatimonadota bacterium]